MIDTIKESILILCIVILSYLGISSIRYVLVHPEKTQTEVVLDFYDVVGWR